MNLPSRHGLLAAQVVFWAVLGLGVYKNSLDKTSAAVFVALWVAGYFGLPRLSWELFVTSYVAVLDIMLVFIVPKGDVDLS